MKNYLITCNIYKLPYLNNALNAIKGIRLFSTTMAKNSPTRNELNAQKHSERLEKVQQDIQRRFEKLEKNKSRKNEDYSRYDDYLSGNNTEQDKLAVVEDHLAELKATYALELKEHANNGLLDADPLVKDTQNRYKNDLDSLRKALKDNNIEKEINPSLEADADNTISAIKVKNEEAKQQGLEQLYDTGDDYDSAD